MGTLKRPKSFCHKRLTNGRYVALMTEVISLAEPLDHEKLGITKLFSAFKAKMRVMTNFVGHKRAFIETRDVHESDSIRIDVFRLLRGIINANRFSTDKDEKNAARTLSLLLKPCIRLSKKPQEERTAAIQSLYVDLAKGENKPFVEKLHLSEIVERMNLANKSFIDEASKRSKSRKAKKQRGDSKKVRAEIDNIYDDWIDRIYGGSLFLSSEELTVFIDKLNAAIEETLNNTKISNGLHSYYKKKAAEEKEAITEETRSESQVSDDNSKNQSAETIFSIKKQQEPAELRQTQRSENLQLRLMSKILTPIAENVESENDVGIKKVSERIENVASG